MLSSISAQFPSRSIVYISSSSIISVVSCLSVCLHTCCHQLVCTIPVLTDQIKEVQSGKTSDILKNKDLESVYQEENALTILYGSNYTPLDLVAKSPDEANIWIAGLNYLISNRDPTLTNGEVN